MNKVEFILELSEKLYGAPNDDIEKSLDYYSEMIDDYIEDGLLEEEAVAAVGAPEEIAKQIIADIPLAKIAKNRLKPKRRLNAFQIVLIVLGSPIWLSLSICAVAVIFSVYVCLWSVIISLWAVFVSLVACAFAGLVAGGALAIYSNIYSGIALIGAGIVCAGLSVFMFYFCKLATKGILMLTKKFALWIKSCFVKKEVA